MPAWPGAALGLPTVSLPNHSHQTRTAIPNRIYEHKAPHEAGIRDNTLEDSQSSLRPRKRSAVFSKDRKTNLSSFARSASGGGGPRDQRDKDVRRRLVDGENINNMERQRMKEEGSEGNDTSVGGGRGLLLNVGKDRELELCHRLIKC